MKLQLTYHFEDEAELRAHLGGEIRAAQPQTRAEVPTDNETSVSVDALDGDQMPYDESVHADPPSFTADGLWRAKRGKGEEAKAARAAFKARGGNVEAPADLPTEVAPAMALPGMPGMPTMNAALPVDAPQPISLDRVIEKISGMISRGCITEQTLVALYQAHSGVADPAKSFIVFDTNETARAKLFAELCLIDP